MAEGQTSAVEPEKQVSSLFTQTTEEEARLAVAAAAAVRPRPSIVVSARNLQTPTSFYKWRRQLQKALKWPVNHRDQAQRNLFNPEVLTQQKRQWSELQIQALERKQQKKEPVSIFEHFVVVGLHPNSNVAATEAAFAKKKTWQRSVEKAEHLSGEVLKFKGPPVPALEAQLLFKYPLGKGLPLKTKELPDFCFPSGVEARVLERTPSLSELNEIMYGQAHQNRDDQSFVFVLKVADNATLYGVCVFVPELVQRAPAFFAMNTDLSPPRSVRSRFLVSAPRCYCLLTRLPFFSLHFEVLNSIIAQERLDRITECVNEMSLAEQVPPMVKVGSKNISRGGSPAVDDPDGWMESAIPVDSVLGATAAAAGLISESEMNSFSLRVSGHMSPDTASELASPQSLTPLAQTQREACVGEGVHCETNQGSLSISRSQGGMEVNPEESASNGDMENPLSNANIDKTKDLGSTSSVGTFSLQSGRGHERADSSESIYSNSGLENSLPRDDSDEDFGEASLSGQEDTDGSEAVLAWAESNNNNSLRILCAYRRLPVPMRGDTIQFQPLEHLSPITFTRPGNLSTRVTGGGVRDLKACQTNLELAEVLAMFVGSLLEKQMVVICPNLGVLSAVVLSIKPMIQPYEWQCLLLPILPNKMLDFLDAPVPFIVGVQHKTAEVRSKSSNLIRVNVYKDKVTMSSMPQLPRQKELMSALEPYHAKLAAEKASAKRHPVHQCNGAQISAVEGFLAVLRSYLESLCTNLRSHTITNVQSNNDKVSLLLKDSFIDSFPPRDQPFIKLFADTQLFAVYTDAVLSSYQHS
ncbi:hypothetical protein BDL97_06G070700 [Sphagnum fallax]|nr:hypothetical protein BDL97_06G070700 [Sphagnum fallax]